MNIHVLADSSLPRVIEFLPAPFHVDFYKSTEELQTKLQQQEILIIRSTMKIDASFLYSAQLHIIATASSGVDHINKELLTMHRIQLIDAKTCNANSVADYVLSCIAYLEYYKYKKIKRIGIIGIGAVGHMIQKRLHRLPYDLVMYDPWRQRVDAEHDYSDQEALYDCDLICIHANLHHMSPFASYHLIDEYFLFCCNA